MVWDGQISSPNQLLIPVCTSQAGRSSLCFHRKCGKCVIQKHFIISWLNVVFQNRKKLHIEEIIHAECINITLYLSSLPNFFFLNLCSLRQIRWTDIAPVSQILLTQIIHLITQAVPCKCNIATAFHCSINTEKCVLNFASQWYNYYYYQTCAANYYKNAELLLAISVL